MSGVRALLAASILLGACTQATDDGSPTPALAEDPSASPSAAPTGPRLADGTLLPSGCTGGGGPSHTVAFVADGRAWALDPTDGDLACMFPVEDPGPFAWGPQGDRVLLENFEVRGVGSTAPDLPAIDTPLTAFDWGHPLGLAIAFADEQGIPRKRYLDDGHLARLVDMPPGDYVEVAYHPSGLALAFVVEADEGQEIWLSTNEGEDPQRLVFSEIGTRFTSLAFSPNGRVLWWTAQHQEGYPELHFMRLVNRTGFGTSWRGEEGTIADGLRLPPSGPLSAVTEGEACEDHRALVLDQGSSSVALADDARPTEALGWLDRTTLLVAAGGCGSPVDVYAVDGTGDDDPIALVLEVELAAPRTRVTNPPRTVPAPPAEEEPPTSGVG
jgi:hypothetical protein